jgi:hypothetical protein
MFYLWGWETPQKSYKDTVLKGMEKFARRNMDDITDHILEYILGALRTLAKSVTQAERA